MTAGLPTADQCEQIFHAALKQGVTADWSDALRILIVHDPHRAERLMNVADTILAGADRSDPS